MSAISYKHTEEQEIIFKALQDAVVGQGDNLPQLIKINAVAG